MWQKKASQHLLSHNYKVTFLLLTVDIAHLILVLRQRDLLLEAYATCHVFINCCIFIYCIWELKEASAVCHY